MYIFMSAPGDYTVVNTTVVFAAGETEQRAVIEIVDDAVLEEETELFHVQLIPVSSGVVTEDTIASVLIEDDDSKC